MYERSKIYCGFYVSTRASVREANKKIGAPSQSFCSSVMDAVEKAIDKELKKDNKYQAMRALDLKPFEAAALVSFLDFSSNRGIWHALKLCGITPNDKAERRIRAACLSIAERLAKGEIQGKLKEAYEASLENISKKNESGEYSEHKKAGEDGKLQGESLALKASRFPVALAIFYFMTIAENVDRNEFLKSVQFIAGFDGFDYSRFIPPVNE